MRENIIDKTLLPTVCIYLQQLAAMILAHERYLLEIFISAFSESFEELELLLRHLSLVDAPALIFSPIAQSCILWSKMSIFLYKSLQSLVVFHPLFFASHSLII